MKIVSVRRGLLDVRRGLLDLTALAIATVLISGALAWAALHKRAIA